MPSFAHVAPQKITRPFVMIRGAGIAGQVLNRELDHKGIPSALVDTAKFPRDKVCGGILQADSWYYLKSLFSLNDNPQPIHIISHYWKSKLISKIKLDSPMFFVERKNFDAKIYSFQRQHEYHSGDTIEVEARGIHQSRGEWIGFHGESTPVNHLEMHYGPNMYLGLSPRSTDNGHVALLIRRKKFRGIQYIREDVESELGVQLHSIDKGTRRIFYGYSKYDLAIGDAKMTTHPFLGLGMKHAILSAKLMAELIEKGLWAEYSKFHLKVFGHLHTMSRL